MHTEKKRQQHHNQPYVDLYPPQSIFNEAMKKAFQWWIVCSSLDTSNFISHRLSSTSINVHTLSEWRRERANGRYRDDIYSIGKESDFYLKRKCLALQLQNRYRFKCCVSPGSDGSACFYRCCCCCCCLVTVPTSFLNAIHKFHTPNGKRNRFVARERERENERMISFMCWDCLICRSAVTRPIVPKTIRGNVK